MPPHTHQKKAFRVLQKKMRMYHNIGSELLDSGFKELQKVCSNIIIKYMQIENRGDALCLRH